MSGGLEHQHHRREERPVIVAFNSNGSRTPAASGHHRLARPERPDGHHHRQRRYTPAQPSQRSARNPVNPGNSSARRHGGAVADHQQPAQVGEGPNASISTASNGFGASGSFNGLAPGGPAAALQVSFADTATAGAKSGTATVALVSDGTFNGGNGHPAGLAAGAAVGQRLPGGAPPAGQPRTRATSASARQRPRNRS